MDIILRKEALSKGLNYYFTGKACAQNHLSERYVSTSNCVECKRNQYKGPDGRNKKSLAAKKYRESTKGRIQRLLDNARRRTKKNGLVFEIDSSDIHIPDYCPITGEKIHFGDDGSLNLNSPSLDRIDNSKGYIKGNVAVISLKANKYKSNMSIEEITNLYNYINVNSA